MQCLKEGAVSRGRIIAFLMDSESGVLFIRCLLDKILIASLIILFPFHCIMNNRVVLLEGNIEIFCSNHISVIHINSSHDNISSVFRVLNKIPCRCNLFNLTLLKDFVVEGVRLRRVDL